MLIMSAGEGKIIYQICELTYQFLSLNKVNLFIGIFVNFSISVHLNFYRHEIVEIAQTFVERKWQECYA